MIISNIATIRCQVESITELFNVCLGPYDRVKCFFCGNILGQWEKDDDPWKEHAQWFPDCPFLVQCKGKGFVSEIQQIVAQQKSAQVLVISIIYNNS